MPRKHIRVARDSIRLLDHSTDLKDQESTSQSPLVSAVTLIKPTKATRAIGGGIKKPTPKKALPVSDDPAKPYVCAEPKCLRGFARKSDLARHHRIHTNERPFICDYKGCGKAFIQKSGKTIHYRTHTGEKPHICQQCSRGFGDPAALARHRKEGQSSCVLDRP